MQTAVFNLLQQLDLDDNFKVDVLFQIEGLDISIVNVKGIPYPYTIVMDIRTWRP